jgi:predicted metal-binding membrane protein
VSGHARTRIAASAVALTATLALGVLAWVVALGRMRGMDMGVATELGSFESFLVLWTAMMTAMMLPGAVPAIVRRAQGGGHPFGAALFALTYLTPWTLVGVLVHALDEPHGSATAGLITIAAGIYELTPLKRECRRRCRAESRSGARLGIACVGSSIGLMAIMAAFGVMSVACMALITVFAAGQKLVPLRAVIDVPLALAIVGLGLLVAFAPQSIL